MKTVAMKTVAMKTVPVLLITLFLLVASSVRELEAQSVTLDLNSQLVNGAYTMEVQVGTPPQTFHAVVDTGSSNLILLGDSSLCGNCSQEFGLSTYDPKKSSSAELSETSFSIDYGSGSLEALEVQDNVSVGSLELKDYTFGVMTHQAGIQNIVGLAYQAKARPRSAPLTPYFDMLVSQAGVANEFSMLLCGDGEKSQITLGSSDIQVDQYIPITEESWYVVSPTKLQTTSGKKISRFSTTTVIDSGTTNLMVTSTMHQRIMKVLNPIAKKNGLDLSKIFVRTTAEVIDQFPVLQVVIENTEGQDITLDISPRTYFKPAGPAGFIFSIGIDNSTILLGQVFMKNYHVVFDRANKRIGFGSNAACHKPG